MRGRTTGSRVFDLIRLRRQRRPHLDRPLGLRGGVLGQRVLTTDKEEQDFPQKTEDE